MKFHLLVFFQIFFVISATYTDLYDDYEPLVKTKVLISSSTNLQFSKTAGSDGKVKVIYDCQEGSINQGIINVKDKYHPTNVKILIIQNCANVTVFFENTERQSLSKLEELKIRNIDELTYRDQSCNYNSQIRTNVLNVDVQDVKLLKISEPHCSNSYWDHQNKTLKIQRVDSLNFKHWGLRENIIKLYLNEVKDGVIDYESIFMSDKGAVLEIKNSHFKTVDKLGLSFKGSHVNLFNNSFENLSRDSFSIEADTLFNLENNIFGVIEDSFNLKGPNVQIVSNNFNIIRKPWLSNIMINNDKKLGILNISKNALNILPTGFLSLHPDSKPDIFYFKNNYFNCSCKYWNLLNSTQTRFGDITEKLFLYENGQNFCLNLGNCPLYKVMSNLTALCNEEFVCDLDNKSNSALIMSALNNISEKLDALLNNSMIIKKN